MNEFQSTGCFYKYRSLKDLEQILSIIIDKKLYGALYKEMNDPMEGYYQYNPLLGKDFMKTLFDGKQKTYICSLSTKGNIGLMWTHYADNNNGCCLEVEITSKTWRKVPVDYKDEMPIVTIDSEVDDILRVKARMWEYEEEVRFLSPQVGATKERPMLSVKINRVLVGCNVTRRKFNHLKEVINALDAKVGIYKMRKSDLDYGYKWDNCCK